MSFRPDPLARPPTVAAIVLHGTGSAARSATWVTRTLPINIDRCSHALDRFTKRQRHLGLDVVRRIGTTGPVGAGKEVAEQVREIQGIGAGPRVEAPIRDTPVRLAPAFQNAVGVVTVVIIETPFVWMTQTSYASEIPLKCSSAARSPGLMSGWYFRASLR